MKKVIVIDDELVNRKLTFSYLSELGYTDDEILMFSSGKEFVSNLSSIKKDEIGYILLDIYMPEITGVDVIEALQNSDLKDIPVIVITTDDKLRSEIERAVDKFVVRPVSFNDFIKVISTYAID